MKTALFLLILLVVPVSSHAANIYKWVDENGVTHFGDTPPGESTYSVPKIKLDAGEGGAADVANTEDNTNDRVIMYSASWCTYCKTARAYFKRKRIRFVEYDIEKSPSARRRYDKLGGRGVPLIVVGDKQLTGFTPESFEQLYNQS